MLEANQVLINTEQLQIVATFKLVPLATENYQEVQRKTYGVEDNQKFWDSGTIGHWHEQYINKENGITLSKAEIMRWVPSTSINSGEYC